MKERPRMSFIPNQSPPLVVLKGSLPKGTSSDSLFSTRTGEPSPVDSVRWRTPEEGTGVSPGSHGFTLTRTWTSTHRVLTTSVFTTNNLLTPLPARRSVEWRCDRRKVPRVRRRPSPVRCGRKETLPEGPWLSIGPPRGPRSRRWNSVNPATPLTRGTLPLLLGERSVRKND